MRLPSPARRTLSVLLVAVSLAACATPDRSAAFRAFHTGRYDSARAMYEKDLIEGGAEQVLDHNAAGITALVQGDLAAAHRHFADAFWDLEDLTATTGETVAAIVGPERSKRWKGDPYERCMNAYYLGVTYWLMGDVDNAAACFRTGVLRDADSEEGEAQSDFALLWYLLAQAQRVAHHDDGGAHSFARSQALLPDELARDGARQANLIVVIDLGAGPVKVAAGPHGAWVRFERRDYTESYGEVALGGDVLGNSVRAVDVYHQAVTRGDKVLDHVNQGKAVFKTGAIVVGSHVLTHSSGSNSDVLGAALLVGGLLLPAEADVRHWAILPGEVHVLAATVPVGTHELSITIRDASDRAVLGVGSQKTLTIEEGETAFVWARSVPTPPGSTGAALAWVGR